MRAVAVVEQTGRRGEEKVQSQWQYWLLEHGLLLAAAFLVILITVSIVLFITSKGLTLFTVNRISPWHFLLGQEWNPTRPAAAGGPAVGVFPYIVGSVLITALAVAISAPLSIMTAIFMVEIAPGWGSRMLQPAIEILAGIPSVVYGWLGLSLLVPWIRGHLGGVGLSLLAGVLVLAVMLLPTIVSAAVDSLRALPREWKEGSLALGATRAQTIIRVLVPGARSGLLTGVILGMARAFGEALAVQMVIGNTRLLPTSLLSPMMTLTSAITIDMPHTLQGSLANNALWSMALILLLISCFFILLIRRITRKGVAA